MDDGIRRSFKQPLECLTLLAEADSQERMIKGVRILSGGRLEPVPGLGSKAPIDRNVEWAELVLFGWRRCGFRLSGSRRIRRGGCSDSIHGLSRVGRRGHWLCAGITAPFN